MYNFKLLLILFIGFIDYLGIGLVYPIFGVMLFDPTNPMLTSDASSSFRGAMFGILMGLTPLSAFIFAPFLGAYSDSHGRKKGIIFGMAAGCLGYSLAVVALFFHSLTMLFAFRILVGITEASAAIAQAAIVDISTEENKARRFSLFSSSSGLGFTIGPFVGGKLAELGATLGIDYSLPFLIAGVLCFVNLILVWYIFFEGTVSKKKISFNVLESFINLRKIFLWKNLLWLFAASFCLSFAWAFFNEFMPVLLQKRFDFSLSDIGNYFAWGGIWYFISSGFLTAPLFARFSHEKIVIYSLLGCAICMAMFSFIEYSHYIWLTLPLLMFFLASSFPTLASIVSNKTDRRIQGEVLGIFYSIQGCAMGLSPMFVGSLIGTYPALTGWGSAVMMVLACLAFLIGGQESKEKSLQTNL